ncbi:MAG: fimbrial assembly protein [Terracidiphilus sp.]|jgi:type IV pilus assembly protein PilN
MRISLNLASRPFADLGPAIKRLRIAMGLLALASIGLGLGLRAIDRKAEEARARDHSLDAQIARINRERQGYQSLMAQPANARLLDQVGTLNRLFDEKAFSWTLAMEDLETVLPGGVQVSTIEPVRAKDGHITLHLHVIGPRDRAVELVRNLEHSKRFLLPRIVGENAESTGGPGQRLEPVSASNRVDFDLLAEYNPALPGERKAAKKPEADREGAGDQPATRAAHPLSGSVFVPQPRMGQSAGQGAIQNRLPGATRPPYTGPPPPAPDSSLYPAPRGPR